MAGYLWMRYSYYWPLEADYAGPLWDDEPIRAADGDEEGGKAYLTVHGKEGRGKGPLRVREKHDVADLADLCVAIPFPPPSSPDPERSGVFPYPRWKLKALDGRPVSGFKITVLSEPERGKGAPFRGRLRPVGSDGTLEFDWGASRWHPASIAGLVVGAMGVFVFAAALRYWLNRRSAFRVEAAEDRT
ncbi:MAG: hypothetical protein ACYSU0_02140 [Planctomycetota bacterium]|jgi:hypothetical protein